jgi:Ca2+-binding RTX toxin-like protein
MGGGSGDDQMLGMQGSDSVSGGSGDDVIDVHAYDDDGADRAHGGSGDDEIWSADGVGNDDVDGGSDADQCTTDPGDAVSACE